MYKHFYLKIALLVLLLVPDHAALAQTAIPVCRCYHTVHHVNRGPKTWYAGPADSLNNYHTYTDAPVGNGTWYNPFDLYTALDTLRQIILDSVLGRRTTCPLIQRTGYGLAMKS